ncbi:DUF1116 domain-containing protein [Sporomusa sp.]|uniref:DUF1116 domain-containing protein n=1 Tax=Sporomusa sp. TaxID=2078658 RepID=UPI002C64F1AB|nr:DUF1116 domain-containing protein [Sporomusa sp.]HWR45980.1 DUF1116 domain-containing protein [Sporomusa sp.]
MSRIDALFQNKLAVLNIGAETFKTELGLQGAAALQLEWKPPAGGKQELIKALDQLTDLEKIEAANAKAVEIIISARPVLVDVDTALNVVPGMTKHTILHAGPPVTWEKMAGPMKGAVIGALIYEGLAQTEEEAVELAASGKIRFAPCHEHDAVGPMAGILSASMPVQIIENKTHGNFAYCSLNEGLGKVLRFGAYGEEVITRLKWIETELGPILKAAVKLSGGIDIRSLIAQAVQMGDECHNRNKAGTSMFIRTITPYLLRAGADPEATIRVIEFINSNDHFFLNLSMPACKAALDAAHGIENSTVVTTMCRNGVEFGIRVSGCPGNTWFTGPAQMIQGLMFPGYTMEDANPDIGDSAITETCGIGGFAMGGAPAIVQFVGGSVEDALGYSQKMFEITLGENPNYANPNLNFRGASTGIDVRKVIASGILPIINTGMAHRNAGIGQVGAGLVRPPVECFEKALLALAEQIK